MRRFTVAAVVALGLLGVYEFANHQSATAPQPTVIESSQPAADQPPSSTTDQQQQLSNDNYYTNSEGQRIHSPAYSNGGVPAGATAKCRDDTYSFSQHRRGTCSHHGGVDQWLY